MFGYDCEFCGASEEQVDLEECESCGALFCNRCGDIVQELCADCMEEES